MKTRMIHCNSEFRVKHSSGRFNEEIPYQLVYIYIYITISRAIEEAAH